MMLRQTDQHNTHKCTGTHLGDWQCQSDDKQPHCIWDNVSTKFTLHITFWTKQPKQNGKPI